MAEQREENPIDELSYKEWFDLACREDEIRQALSELTTKLARAGDAEEEHELDRKVFELEQELNWLREQDKQLEEQYRTTTTIVRRGKKVLAGARDGGKRNADKNKAKYPHWQKLADEVWAKNLYLSRLAVAKKIAPTASAPAETIRRHIRKRT